VKLLVVRPTSYNYFPGSVQPFVSFLQGCKQEQKRLKANLFFFYKTEKTVVEKNKKWDSQSEVSNFKTPESEGLLVTKRNGKPIGVTRPQLEI